jgi:hypothetical protein
MFSENLGQPPRGGSQKGYGNFQFRQQLVAWITQGEKLLEDFDRMYPGIESGKPNVDERILQTIKHKLDFFARMAELEEVGVDSFNREKRLKQATGTPHWTAIYKTGQKDLLGVKQHAKTMGLQDICDGIDLVMKNEML